MNVNLNGLVHVVLKKHGEHYSWKKVTTNISNLTQPSNPKMYHEGEMVITNHKTRERCVLHFHPQGKRDEDSFHVTGIAYDSEGRKRYLLRGRWNDKLISEPLDGDHENDAIAEPVLAPRLTAAESAAVSQGVLPNLANGANNVSANNGAVATTMMMMMPTSSSPSPLSVPVSQRKRLLWHITPLPDQSSSYYGFCAFTFRLNELTSDLRRYLPPTDSRWRPDQRSLEEGKIDLATQQKDLLEKSQRSRRKSRLEKNLEEEPEPFWFERSRDEDSGTPLWRYRGQYWDARGRQQWPGVPHIFEIG